MTRRTKEDQHGNPGASLRDQAQYTFDAVRKQLKRQAQERFREALDRIGAKYRGDIVRFQS